MSKPSVFENKSFQNKASAGTGFNLAPQVNSFNAIFDPKPLDALEETRIEKLLVENYQPGAIQDEQVKTDVLQLKRITAEIKSISKQGIVLMGERVHQAMGILKPYKDGTFTKWLEATFGARRTGYNVLAYFELYKALPSDSLRERLKKIPLRAAYALASRVGDADVKEEIIREHHDLKHNELVTLIQEKLPVASTDRRSGKSSNDRLIAKAHNMLEKLLKRKAVLSEGNKQDVAKMRELLDSILS